MWTSSRRLPPDLSLNATTRLLRSLQTRGVELLDLTASNPTVVGFEYPPGLLSSLATPRALTYSPEPLGLREARHAIAADFARRGLLVSPERIAVTASTSEAYAWLFKLLCDPGDNVLVPRPSYPLFEHLARFEAVEVREYRLDEVSNWHIDLEHLAAAFDARTRAVVCVSPNNPTGSIVHRHELDALTALCVRHGVPLIADEVFADYLFAPTPPVTPSHEAIATVSAVQSKDALTCTLGGCSKSVGLPQVKLAWIAFAGPAPQVEHLLKGYELIADSYLSASTPVQCAAATLLTDGASVRTQIQARLTHNLAALQEAVRQFPAVSLLPVAGGWSAVLRVPAWRSEEALVHDLLARDRVLVHPGFFFDFEREAYVVVSLLTRPAAFRDGLARVLARVVDPVFDTPASGGYEA